MQSKWCWAETRKELLLQQKIWERNFKTATHKIRAIELLWLYSLKACRPGLQRWF